MAIDFPDTRIPHHVQHSNPWRRRVFPALGRLAFRLRSIIDRRYRLIQSNGPISVGRGVLISGPCAIGKWTYLRTGTYVGRETRIGNYCCIARFADIGPVHHDYTLPSNHEFQLTPKRFGFDTRYRLAGLRKEGETSQGRPPVIIGHDVWIGTKATVLRGAKIGTGAIIAAGAVVTGTVPDYAIMAGVPARRIGMRFPPPTVKRLLASRWWERDPADLEPEWFFGLVGTGTAPDGQSRS